MDEIKNNAALEAEQTAALVPAAPAEEPEEESLALAQKLSKMIQYDTTSHANVASSRGRNTPRWTCPPWRT